jgi:dephospho-CoA kinase
VGHPEIWGKDGGRLLIVGLTGGIASGKSEVAGCFQKLGAKVIDADVVAREVVLPGSPVFQSLVSEFGDGILDDSGAIDRVKLGGVCFGDDARLKRLNELTHPAIFQRITDGVVDHAVHLRAGDVPAVIIDAALIVDVGASAMFDMLVVVSADRRARIFRLVGNRGMERAEAEERIDCQVPDETRVAGADLVIVNNGTLEELFERVKEAWSVIASKAGAKG